MDKLFLMALNAEIEHLEKISHLSEEEQCKEEEKWVKSKEYQIFKAYIKAAVLLEEKNSNE